jgi:hypothetical protein
MKDSVKEDEVYDELLVWLATHSKPNVSGGNQ